MNVVLGISALLLGGVALPGSNPTTDESAVPEATSPTRQAAPARSIDQARARVGGGMTASPGYGGGLFGGGGVSAGSQGFVPVAPTDPGLSSPDSPWAAPTENVSPGVSPGFGSRATTGGSMLGRRPAVGSPSGGAAGHPAYRPYSQGIAQQVQASRLQAMGRPANAAQGPKPFAGYTPPPTTSPYMDLYRISNEGYNNYTQLVKPALEQQQQNQTFVGQIRGLQSASRLQSMGMQRLGKSQGQRSTNTPEYYMNYQNYYPAFR